MWTQQADFGPDPCAAAAMVFKGSRIALFGGIDSANATPAPVVFANTWQWDGKRWALVQDIGPGPRWRHALAYDANRGHMVLFGELPVGPNDPNLANRVHGDTWEHSEAASRPPVTVQSLVISPASVVAPGSAFGMIKLSGPAPSGGVVVQLTTDRPDQRLSFRPGPQVILLANTISASFSIDFSGSIPAPMGFDITALLGSSSQDAIVTFTP